MSGVLLTGETHHENDRNKKMCLGHLGLLCMLTLSPCYAGDEAGKQQQLGKWVMTYYQHPAPEQFVEKVKEMAAAGLLHRSKPKPKPNAKPNARPNANVMFLGKIMAANANWISDWMDALTSLPAADATARKRAVWYSGTAEGGAGTATGVIEYENPVATLRAELAV